MDSRVGLSSDAICGVSPDVVAREIEGDIIIVPLVAGIGDADDELYTLNETGGAVWRLLDGRRTLAEIVQELSQEFEAAASVLQEDVLGFATEMVRRGILTVK